MRARQQFDEALLVVFDLAAMAVDQQADQPVDAELLGAQLPGHAGDEIVRRKIEAARLMGHGELRSCHARRARSAPWRVFWKEAQDARARTRGDPALASWLPHSLFKNAESEKTTRDAPAFLRGGGANASLAPVRENRNGCGAIMARPAKGHLLQNGSARCRRNAVRPARRGALR